MPIEDIKPHESPSYAPMYQCFPPGMGVGDYPWELDNFEIRPVAGQESSQLRFSFMKHFRTLYLFIPNMIQINQRLCRN